MDGFLDVSKALWKGLYSRRDYIQQHINFPAVLWTWLKTKDEGCAIYAVARCSLFDDWRRYLPLTFYLVVFPKNLRSTDKPDKRYLSLCAQLLYGSARSYAYSQIWFPSLSSVCLWRRFSGFLCWTHSYSKLHFNFLSIKKIDSNEIYRKLKLFKNCCKKVFPQTTIL